METTTGSTTELAEKMGCEYAVASAVLKWLEQKGIAKKAGSRPNAGGRGKAATLYTIPTTAVTLSLLK